MPRFSYKAKQGPSKIINGVIEAETRDGAIHQVIRQGLTPIDVFSAIEEKKAAPASTASTKPVLFSQKIKTSEVVLFTRQMSDLIAAAVPLLKSMQLVEKQTQNPAFRQSIHEMHDFIRDGGSFSDAVSKYPKVFSQLYIHMIRVGELAGQLEIVLSRLADYLEKEQETISRVKSSLAYPALILAVGVITVFILLTFVIPRLSVMFEDLNQQLPLPTLVLLSVSHIFARFWWAIIIGFLGLGLYFKRWVQTDRGKLWLDKTLLKIPYLGEFLKVVEVGRFARTLATLIEAGVTITSALNAILATVDNYALREQIRQMAEEVSQGTSLKTALQKCSLFPEMAVNMISVGEETGRLEKGLYKIADTYQRQADQAIKTVLSLLGPVVLVIIVSLVGFVVVAMLLPIFQMNMLIQ